MPKKYVVLTNYHGAFIRGDVVSSDDLATDTKALLTAGSIREATTQEAKLGAVAAETLEPSERDLAEKKANKAIADAIAESVAANPRRDGISMIAPATVEQQPQAVTEAAQEEVKTDG